MCSVVGYIGNNLSRSIVLKGLEKLEYRGYDSAGFACLDQSNNSLQLVRAAGALSNLYDKVALTPIDGMVGIGHTRWATHGAATELNAHPHVDCTNSICVVHNGIIENHHALRQALQISHIIKSQTDTELIAHLYESALELHTDVVQAVCSIASQLEGAYAFVAIAKQHPDIMVAVRKGSPLCIGMGNGQTYVASDVFAFADYTQHVAYLPEKSFAIVRKDTFQVFDFAGNQLSIPVIEIEAVPETGSKCGYEHFMLKEIYEQKRAIRDTIADLEKRSDTIWPQLGLTSERVQALESLQLIGSGTSWHAGRIAQFFFEAVCNMPVGVALSSEFCYMPLFAKQNSVYLAISQSGETADTLQVMRRIQEAGLPTAVLTNVATSSMVREADGALFTKAGQEIAVASTKAFSTQLAALFWLSHRIAVEKKLITQDHMASALEQLTLCSELMENSIEQYKQIIISEYAPRYAQYKRFIFLGRHISYPFALEASLKLKEISYLFSQCYPAGELKHGPIALVDEETPVFIFSSVDPLIYQKLLSNAQEVKARKGHIIVFAFEGQHELIELADAAIVLPRVHPLLAPLAMTSVMQFFVYQIAKELGCAIDKPRNLAKSVTVE